jgi:DNA-directed RNA polymerase subunit RPC12/RpoP
MTCTLCNKTYKTKTECLCSKRTLEYISKLKNIILIDNYINMRIKILHKCLDCNLEFKTSPKSILNSKHGCPSCSGKLFSKQKYESLLPKNIKLISGDYIGSNYIHEHLCLDCNNSFKTKPNYIIHMNTNCPCYKYVLFLFY